MSAPTPTTYTQWDGSRGMTYWRAQWTDATQLTDSVVVDVSALSPSMTAVKILGIKGTMNGDLEATIEFDATTDELVYVFEGQGDVSMIDVADFTSGPSNARVPDQTAAGFTGDVMVTTVGAASGDEATLMVYFQRAS
jgi:hypothetical protein